MKQAVIFDMDGLLVDTEPFWQQAEQEVFREVGIQLSPDLCAETTGLRIDEVVAHWYDRHPWEGISLQEVSASIVDRVAELTLSQGELMQGVYHAIGTAKAAGMKVGLASSSPMRLIEAILGHFDLARYFEVVVSAEVEEFGKPHPAVYLRAAQALGVSGPACTAVEDSFNGLLAAKAARMRCLLVPDAAHRQDPRWSIADARLWSLAEVEMRHFC